MLRVLWPLWIVQSLLSLLVSASVPLQPVARVLQTSPQRSVQQQPPLPRAITDRPDDSIGFQIHVIYGVPSDGQDFSRDTNGTIRDSLTVAQTWLGPQLDGRNLRFDTYQGQIDITFVRLPKTEATYYSYGPGLHSYLSNALIEVGFDQPGKKYLLYYEGRINRNACGVGSTPPVGKGHLAALYILNVRPSGSVCNSQPFAGLNEAPRRWEYLALHEVFHTLGIVPQCAKNVNPNDAHVHDDPRDLMYTGPLPYMPTMIDAGRDDYYRHGNPNCLDLDKSPYLKPANVAVAPVQDIFLAECNGQAATIVGDGLPVFGTDGDDVIVAGFSNEVNGGPGNDLICGNNNNNILVGGLGDDIIFGMGGDDQLFGGNGKDTLYGGPGNDRLFGQNGNDILDGGPGTDRCNGGSGNNTRTNCE